MADIDKIYLVGFMGAGKSSVARALGRRLGWRVDDVDERIEAREKQSVADIFRLRGEGYFRAVEREVLIGLLPARHSIVATGGGTFVDPDNRARMLADGLVVWLDAPLETAIARVPRDGRRPLAADRARFTELFWARRAAYELAHVRIDASRPIEEIVERLLDQVGW